MDAIDNSKAHRQQQGMFEQITEGGSVTHYIDQVAAGTVDRQKRE